MSSFGLRRSSSSGKKDSGNSKAKAAPKLSYDPADITNVFNAYSEKSQTENVMDMDSIVEFCKDLGIDPLTDVTILQIAWKLKQTTPMEFTKDQFEGGMASLGVDSIAKLKETGIPSIKVLRATKLFFHDIWKRVYPLTSSFLPLFLSSL